MIALVLACTVVKGWKRWALLVPTIWVAAFVWENVLIEQSPTTRPLFLGVILIVLMSTRPAGLFGTAAGGDRMSDRTVSLRPCSSCAS